MHALDIRPITPGARARYTEAWNALQARFVDDPSGALADADRLLADVMRDRGYPAENAVDRRIEDLSVEHAKVMDNYRLGNDIVEKDARGEASTEDLRRAMVAYRSLFADLVGAEPDGNLIEGRSVPPRSSNERRTPSTGMNDAQTGTEKPRTERGDLQASNADVALLPEADRVDLQTAWERVQVGFVDEPRQAVQRAHELVGQLVDALTDSFERQRETLEGSWSSGADVSTEDLRLALQRYRSLFNRLLST